MRILTPCMCVLHLPSSCGLLHAGPSVADHEAFWAEWALRIKTLERGIEQAREQGISVSKAKRVLKELQAQANAAEAASKLEALLLRKPCKASTLKVSSCLCSLYVAQRACLPLDKFRFLQGLSSAGSISRVFARSAHQVHCAVDCYHYAAQLSCCTQSMFVIVRNHRKHLLVSQVSSFCLAECSSETHNWHVSHTYELKFTGRRCLQTTCVCICAFLYMTPPSPYIFCI